MSLKKQVEDDLRAAIRAQDKDEIRALRGIKSMILLAETEKGAQSDLSGDTELKLLTKAAKQRRDSAQLYQEQGRDDLAGVELAELEVITRYLPKQLSQEELTDHLKRLIGQVGAEGPKDMGKVMGIANRELQGKADGAAIAGIVKKLLSN